MAKDNFTLGDDASRISSKGVARNSNLQLPVTDWMADLSENDTLTDLVEVQFKKTRKGYYHNNLRLPLHKGMMVAVDAANGYDVGEVTLTGKLVELQMKKYRIDLTRYEVRNITRIANENDLNKREEAKSREHETMIKARQLAKQLELQMKIGDVEYQGDGTKAIFYYIADERVDFRQLIKVFAETFRVRIEMKQIGARQEAGRIGGTGPCGRELCCATWMTQFNSVGTGAARLQNLSTNPQKLAGQCAKLKCCLNYEIDIYQDALKAFPDRNITLETKDGTFYHFSSDPLAHEITYSSAPHVPANLQTISPERAHEIIAMNKRGEKPESIGGKQTSNRVVNNELGYQNVVGQDDVTRFDKRKNERRHDRREGDRRNDRGRNNHVRHHGNRNEKH